MKIRSDIDHYNFGDITRRKLENSLEAKVLTQRAWFPLPPLWDIADLAKRSIIAATISSLER